MNGRPLLTLVFCITVVSSFAQVRSQKAKRDSIRSLTVARFGDYFFIWPVLKQRSTSFDFKTNDKSAQTVKFRPNNSFHAGFGMYLFEIGLELTFDLPLETREERRYGKSNSNDLQLNIFSKNWGADVFISDYRGFYKEDSKNRPGPNMPYPQRPDIHTHSTGINGIYIFQPNKFSLRSAFNFAERQKKSGGSLTLTGTFNSYRITADSAVLSQKDDQIFAEFVDFTRLRNTTFSVVPGYAYNVIVRNFFLNTSLAVGPALNWFNYFANDKEHPSVTVNNYIDFRMAIGYNGERFFTGINFVNKFSSVRFEKTTFTNSSNTFKIVVGYRFREFGVLKRKASDLLFFVDK